MEIKKNKFKLKKRGRKKKIINHRSGKLLAGGIASHAIKMEPISLGPIIINGKGPFHYFDTQYFDTCICLSTMHLYHLLQKTSPSFPLFLRGRFLPQHNTNSYYTKSTKDVRKNALSPGSSCVSSDKVTKTLGFFFKLF